MEFSILAAIVLVLGLFVAAFLYEMGRRIYFASMAKLQGWTARERFDRETAWLERVIAKEERLAERDVRATANSERRRLGVFIATIAIGFLAFQLGLRWWEIAFLEAAVYAGLTMASGLAWKWW